MLAMITARMGSSRLAGKVMLPLAGKPVLQHLVERIQATGHFDPVVLATSKDPANDVLEELATSLGIETFRGAEDDVLDRYVSIMRKYDAGNAARFCADNPFTDVETAVQLSTFHTKSKNDYSIVHNFQVQLGLVEIYSRFALEEEIKDTDPNDHVRRESVGIFILENKDKFRIGFLPSDPHRHAAPFRLTLDYPEDYDLLTTIAEHFKNIYPVPYADVLEYLYQHPDIAAKNASAVQSTGNNYWTDLVTDLSAKVMK